MFPRQFTRRISYVSFLAVATFSADNVAAQATPPVAGWHSPSAAQPSSNRAAHSARQWRMPDGQVAVDDSDRARPAESATVNPLRQKRVAPSVREPEAFQEPAQAQAMRARTAHNRSTMHGVGQGGGPSAVTTTAALMQDNSQVQGNRPAAYRRPAPRVSRPSSELRSRKSVHTPVWQRINVAMQGPSQFSEDAGSGEESLPTPSRMQGEVIGPEMSDPFGPNSYYLEDDAQYYPSCGPDGCSGGCGCGDACEPGCGCGCSGGVYRCDGECCNDCLCIGPGDAESCHSVRVRVPKWQELSVFGGVQGFKGPYDQERDSGNFGFHEGFNSGFKIPYTFAGYQIGYQAAQSQLNGDENTDNSESHTQHFITFGLFRRAQDGLQFGTAWDVLRDQRFEAADFHQLRNEISWMDCGKHEFGLSATIGLNEVEDQDDDDEFWTASDQYVLFYRVHGERGGEGRIYGGWNDSADGILGADMNLPVHDRWSVQSGFTYMIPDARDGEDGASEEAWNINLGLVWHWGCRARKSYDNPYRPLFNVANNGYLIVDSRED